MAGERCKILLSLSVKHKELIIKPTLEKIDIKKYSNDKKIGHVTICGESGNQARVLNYDWVIDIRNQCKENNVGFFFKQTGFYKKWQRISRIKSNADGSSSKSWY